MTNNDSAIAIVGGGVAGLICACKLIELGRSVTLIDHAKKLGQKWLLASSSGMNFSVNATPQVFAKAFGEHAPLFEEYFASFGSREFNDWLQKWGFSLKKGNGTRLFAEGGTPKELLAIIVTFLQSSPLCTIKTDCNIISITQDILQNAKNPSNSKKHLWQLETSHGNIIADRIIFACGGMSYPQTGSDGSWIDLLKPFNVTIQPFCAANSAFKVNWSEKMQFFEKYEYVKNVSVNGTRGDLVLTPFGLEGSPVYPHSQEHAIHIDLFPDLPLEQLQVKLENGIGQGKKSFSAWLKNRLHLSNAAFSLIMETTSPEIRADTKKLASNLKKLQFKLLEPAPIAKAISCSGGLSLSNVTKSLESKDYPGIYFCGEMLDINPPTGGYLIQTCFTTASIVAASIF